MIEAHARFAAGGAVTIYRGHAGVRSWLGETEEAWGAWPRGEAGTLVDFGEHTLLFYVLRARGRRSGVQTTMPWAKVARWRDALCRYVKTYADRKEALADLGLAAP